MNLENAFLTSLARAGLPFVLKARAVGIKSSDVDTGEAKAALEFLYDYAQRYKDVPTEALLSAKVGLDIDPQPGSADFFIDEMLNRRLFRRLKDGLRDSANFLDRQKPRDALQALETLIRDVRRDNLASSPIEKLFSLGPEVLSQYEDVKAGKKGILTRWPSINDATLGFWPQDLVLFVARVATGKTWSSIIIAQDAWEGRWIDFEGMRPVDKFRRVCTEPQKGEDPKCSWIGGLRAGAEACPACGGNTERKGSRVLYVTTEISKLRIASRFYAVKYKLPYKQFRAGKLSSVQEERFRGGVQALLEADGLYIVGGDFDFTIGGLEAAIEEAEPDMVVLDGAYLMRSEGRNRSEQAANTFDDLKRLLHRYKLAGVVTSQLNRQANPNQRATVNTESIALTDVAGWNSDMVVGMIQDEKNRSDQRMFFKPLKVREGEGKEIELVWDFAQMVFDELPRAAPNMGFATTGPASGDANEDGAVEDDMPF